MKIFVDGIGKPCSSCTECCKGRLTGHAFGNKFGHGNRCKFLNYKGCSIYEIRPHVPCKVFQCGWKIDSNIPDWMRPDKSGVIIIKKYYEPFHFLRLVKTLKPTDPRVYEWAEEFSNNGTNIIAFDENGKLLIFSKNEDFVLEIKKELKEFL